MMVVKLSFEQYFLKYYQQAYKYTNSKVLNLQIAEDLVMDAFVSCYQKFDEFDDSKASFATWLYVILNNKIKNYYRNKKEDECIDDWNDIIDSQEDDIFQSIYLSEIRSALACAMETLNETQKQIVVKKYFENKSSNEIADDIGTTSGNVRVQRTRALKKLNEYFKKHNYNWEM